MQTTQNVNEIRYESLELTLNVRGKGAREIAHTRPKFDSTGISCRGAEGRVTSIQRFRVSVSKTRFEATNVFPFARPYYRFDDVGLLLLEYFPDKEVQGNAEYLGRPRGYRNKKIIILFSFFQTTVSSVCVCGV